MLNHRRKPNARWSYDHTRKGFLLVASEPIARGATVHDTYGQRSNQLYLKAYGFVFDGYPVAQHTVNVRRHGVAAVAGGGDGGGFDAEGVRGTVRSTPADNTTSDGGGSSSSSNSNSNSSSSSSMAGNALADALPSPTRERPYVPHELLLHNHVRLPVRLDMLLDVLAWSCHGVPLVEAARAAAVAATGEGDGAGEGLSAHAGATAEEKAAAALRRAQDGYFFPSSDSDPVNFPATDRRAEDWFAWLLRDGLSGGSQPSPGVARSWGESLFVFFFEWAYCFLSRRCPNHCVHQWTDTGPPGWGLSVAAGVDWSQVGGDMGSREYGHLLSRAVGLSPDVATCPHKPHMTSPPPCHLAILPSCPCPRCLA